MAEPVIFKLNGETDPLQIALNELKAKKIPIIIRSHMPDKSYENRSIDELIVD